MSSKIKHYDQRVEYWSSKKILNGFDNKWINDEIILALEEFRIFNGMDVLEIGPGTGRQYRMFKDHAKSYELADISKDVLNNEEYKLVNVNLIKSWSTQLKHRYDIITFWFVIHHVLKSEIEEFIKFLDRHLRRNGLLIFNAPIIDSTRKGLEDDGIHTTPWKRNQVISYFEKKSFTTVKGPIDYRNNEFFIFQI